MSYAEELGAGRHDQYPIDSQAIVLQRVQRLVGGGVGSVLLQHSCAPALSGGVLGHRLNKRRNTMRERGRDRECVIECMRATERGGFVVSYICSKNRPSSGIEVHVIKSGWALLS